MLHAIHTNLRQLILLHPYGFLGLEISTAIAESRYGLGFVYITSLFTFEGCIALSLNTLYLHKRHLFPVETTIRNAPNG